MAAADAFAGRPGSGAGGAAAVFEANRGEEGIDGSDGLRAFLPITHKSIVGGG
jgi:hypothetical protein